MTFETKDSGKRINYDSGMVRDTTDGKARYDLIPLPMLKRLAELYARGAEKYDKDLPINIDNWYNVCTTICKKNHLTDIEYQTATPKKYTQAGVCVLSAIEKNIRNQNEPIAIRLKSPSHLDFVNLAMTENSKNETQNMLKSKEKITKNGLKTTLKNIKSNEAYTVKSLITELENLFLNVNEHYYRLDLLQQMKQNFLKYKKMVVEYAVDSQADYSLTSTIYTERQLLEACYVENVIKDLECWVMILKDLENHSNTCKTLQCLKLNETTIVLPNWVASNWTLANSEQELQRFKGSAFRHFVQWQAGELDEDHAAGATWNIFAYEIIKEKLNEIL